MDKLFLTKVQTQSSGQKILISASVSGITGYKKINLDPYLIPHTKIIPKCTVDLKI